jgi:DNA modification methylase
MRTNVIYCGDCKNVLADKIAPESVDLIYLDPPFFTNKDHEVIFGDKEEVRAFKDRWAGGINTFALWLEERLAACRDVLKNTGSIYTHCDWRASHYIRMSMDRIFGYDNFKNEIIWHFGLGGGPRDHWNRKHNNIFFYTKSSDFTFNMQYVPATSQRMKGEMKKRDDVWDIPSINNMARERVGYPTQKPEALLELIAAASSNPEDLVLDPFCGCGTTLAVAHKLGRKWIGVDVSPTSCRVVQKRLEGLEGITKVELLELPVTIDELTAYDPFTFQSYVCGKLGGCCSERKSGDLGIDGYCADGTPIQVKQSEGVGRNVIDNFETAIRRKKKKEGIIIAFSFSKSTYEEVSRAEREDNLKIQLLNVHELLEKY